MPLSFAYWILVLFHVLVGAYWGWQVPTERRFSLGGWLLLDLLILIVIGLKIFRAPLRDG